MRSLTFLSSQRAKNVDEPRGKDLDHLGEDDQGERLDHLPALVPMPPRCSRAHAWKLGFRIIADNVHRKV